MPAMRLQAASNEANSAAKQAVPAPASEADAAEGGEGEGEAAAAERPMCVTRTEDFESCMEKALQFMAQEVRAAAQSLPHACCSACWPAACNWSPDLQFPSSRRAALNSCACSCA